MQTDNIIERAKAKDPKALNEIYAMYYPKMVGVCMKIAKEDEDTVHDLVHDAFVLAFASLGNLRNNERFGEWLTTIVRNVTLKHISQKDKIHFVPLSNVDSNDVSLLDFSSQADSAINYGDIMHAISQLPEGYSKVIRLSLIEGFSHKEIASMLGIEAHSSSSQLSRAKGLLKQILGYKQLAIIIVLLISIPLYFILSRRDEPNVCEIRPDKKKTEEKKKLSSPKWQEDEPIPAIRIAEEHNKVVASDNEQKDTLAIPSLHDIQYVEKDQKMIAETKEDSVLIEQRDSVIAPIEHHEPLLAETTPLKKNKWKFLAAGSFGPALAQNAYKLLQTGSIGDIDSEVPTFPENINTWEDYSRYLHITQHDNTPADTLALIDIADHNTGDITEKEEHDKPVTFGISVSKTLTDRWCIETGIQYSLLHSRFTMGENGYSIVKKQKAHYLGIPLKLSYRVFDYKHISAYSSTGLTLHIPMYGKQTCNYIVNWQTAYSDNYHFTPAFQWQTSFSVGLQYKFTPNASVFVEPTINWFVPSNCDKHTIWTEQPIMFTSPFGIRITW
ncbi:MAG: sigma-70 family RNA polymerase sigma factor [Acetatifactor sp.]